jgi:hypothetical protein
LSVALLTLTSVAWADSSTAISSSNGEAEVELGGGVRVVLPQAAEGFGHRGQAHVGHQADLPARPLRPEVSGTPEDGGLDAGAGLLAGFQPVAAGDQEAQGMKAPGGRMATRKPG